MAAATRPTSGSVPRRAFRRGTSSTVFWRRPTSSVAPARDSVPPAKATSVSPPSGPAPRPTRRLTASERASDADLAVELVGRGLVPRRRRGEPAGDKPPPYGVTSVGRGGRDRG